jgi:hypothetical protein
MVEQGGGNAGIRRAAVGSVTALLVLGSAVGAAVAGLPHGKHVEKKIARAPVFGPKKAIPPATGESGSGPGLGSTAKLPGAGTGSKPPAIAPETPHGSDSTSLPDVGSSGGSGGGGSSSGGSSPPSNSGDTTEGKPKDKNEPSTEPHGSPRPTLFADGEYPVSATVFNLSGPSGASGADHTIDSHAKTAWTTKAGDRGIMVTPNPGSYDSIAIITETAGWSLTVYRSNVDSPGGLGGSDWKQDRIKVPVGRENKLSVHDAKHYLVWVDDLGGKKQIRINEIQVFQK